MGPCKIFLVGEGASDIGDLAKEPTWRDLKQPREGFLQPILRRLAPDMELEFEGRQLLSLAPADDDAPFEIASALAAKAGKALALASLEGASFLVLITDVDREHARKRSAHEARRQMGLLRRNIETGFTAARARSQKLSTVTTVVATPMRMVEAWALGDPAALPRQMTSAATRPEELWGAKRDPQSNFPKHVLKRALGRDPSPEDFADLGERVDLDTLCETCPASFRPFAEEVTTHAARCRLPSHNPARQSSRPSTLRKKR